VFLIKNYDAAIYDQFCDLAYEVSMWWQNDRQEAT
jgi:hypothetical protein